MQGDLNNENAVSPPLSPVGNYFKTILWVQLYWHKELYVPKDLKNECAEFFSTIDDLLLEDHLLSRTLLTWRAVARRTWAKSVQSLCPVSPPNGHFRSIFWAQLYQLKEHYVPEDLSNECELCPSVCHYKKPFQGHLLSTSQLTPRALSLWETRTMNVQSFSSVSIMIGYCKTIFWVQLYHLTKLCIGRPEKWTCRVSTSVSLINDHYRTTFWVQCYQLIRVPVSQEIWTINVKEFLPKWHWWTLISRLSPKYKLAVSRPSFV